MLIVVGVAGYIAWMSITLLFGPTPQLPLAANAKTPCAITTRDALRAINLEPTRRFRFRGVTYGLKHGQAECTLTKPRGQLGRHEVAYCQFSRPGVVEVQTSTATYLYAPGPRKPATVWFVDGAPQCAADFDLKMLLAAARGEQQRPSNQP